MRIAACRMNSRQDKTAVLDTALALLEQAAARAGLSVLAGSVHADGPDGCRRNVSLLIDPVGRIAARYDKLHLFDIGLAGQPSYRESADWRRCVVVQDPAEASAPSMPLSAMIIASPNYRLSLNSMAALLTRLVTEAGFAMPRV